MLGDPGGTCNHRCPPALWFHVGTRLPIADAAQVNAVMSAVPLAEPDRGFAIFA
jgi:hypothetical protein